MSGKPPTPQALMEKRWDKDMPAYKRLRRDGLQPPTIDGSSALEGHATTRLEVEMGKLFQTKKDLVKAKQGLDMAYEMKLRAEWGE